MTSTSRYGDPRTRARILDAAWELVEERGLRVAMSEVATAAGVSRQAVYLHVGDRSGLFLALVEHIDSRLDLAAVLRPVRQPDSGLDALEQMVSVHAHYTAHIIGLARQVDAARHTDPDVAAAWDNRMAGRRRDHRRIVQRLDEEGRLAPGWDVESASLLFYTVTLPRTWDELVTEQGWSVEQYREHMTRLLTRAFVTPGQPPA